MNTAKIMFAAGIWLLSAAAVTASWKTYPTAKIPHDMIKGIDLDLDNKIKGIAQ